MKRLKYFLSAIWFLSAFSLHAQNYVTNGDFEENLHCDGHLYFLVPNWNYIVNLEMFGFHACNDFEGNHHGVPYNDIGHQYPQSGNGMTAMSFYRYEPSVNNSSRGYMNTMLNETLKQDSLYCLSYYVSLADVNRQQNTACGQFGALALPYSMLQWDGINLSAYTPQVESPVGVVVTDSIGWYKVTGVFKANGGEDMLILGNFRNNDETDTLNLAESFVRNAAYFVDNVQLLDAPPIYKLLNLGQDTTICTDGAFQHILQAPVGFDSYKWSDGSQSNTLTVTQPGVYWVEVDAGCGAYRDSILIETDQAPHYEPIGNIEHCGLDEMVLLDMSDGFTAYAWNVGGNSDSLYISPVPIPITYVGYAFHPCLSLTDTIVAVFYPLPDPPVVFNDTLCSNEIPIPLSAQGQNLLWYSSMSDTNGSAQAPVPNEEANGEQYFYVSQTDASTNCESEKSEIVILVQSLPEVNLGDNRIECIEDENILSVENDGYDIVWRTGETSHQIEATVSNLYWVEVSNDCGSVRDSVFIELVICSNTLFLPNCFTPNGDGINDVLDVVQQNNTNIELIIYNRLGRPVYESKKSPLPWNGIYENELIPQDIYNYKLSYIDFNNEYRIVRGHISVMY